MEDQNRTKEELINELRQLRKRITEVEALERERKKVENTTRESGEQLQILADSLPVLISYVDSEQRYRLNNKAYQRWFGKSPTETCGKHIKDVLGEVAYQAIQPYVKGHITFINQAAKKIYDHEPEEMIGRIFTDFVLPEQIPGDMRCFEQMLATGKPVIEYENRVVK